MLKKNIDYLETMKASLQKDFKCAANVYMYPNPLALSQIQIHYKKVWINVVVEDLSIEVQLPGEDVAVPEDEAKDLLSNICNDCQEFAKSVVRYLKANPLPSMA